jgi:hypothetical protein
VYCPFLPSAIPGAKLPAPYCNKDRNILKFSALTKEYENLLSYYMIMIDFHYSKAFEANLELWLEPKPLYIILIPTHQHEGRDKALLRLKTPSIKPKHEPCA